MSENRILKQTQCILRSSVEITVDSARFKKSTSLEKVATFSSSPRNILTLYSYFSNTVTNLAGILNNLMTRSNADELSTYVQLWRYLPNLAELGAS